MSEPKTSEQLSGRWPTSVTPMRTCVLAVLGLYLRKPDSFFRPQFWAEDGSVFFKDAVELGLPALWKPYAGYYHLVPRLSSFSYLAADYVHAPLVYHSAAAVVYLLFVLYVFTTRVPLPLKPVCALLPLFGPVGMEVHLTVTNTQWIVALCLPLLMISDSPRNTRDYGVDLAVMLICGLSGPFIALLLPCIFLRFALRKDRGSGLLCLGASLIASIQIASLMMHNDRVVKPFLEPDFIPFFLKALAHFLAYPVPFSFTYDSSLTAAELFLSLSLILLFFTLVAIAVLRKQANALLLLVAAVTILLTSLALREHPKTMLFGSTRYFFVPKTLFLWAIVTMLFQLHRKASLLMAFIPLLYLLDPAAFVSTPLKKMRWKRYAKCLDTKEECYIPLNPDGWGMIVRPPLRVEADPSLPASEQ